MSDPYKVLGVSRDASMDEIKKACGVELDVNEMDQFDSVDHMYKYLQANH